MMTMKLVLPIIIILISGTASANSDHLWGEIGFGSADYGIHLQLKTRNNNSGWGLVFSRINQEVILNFVVDRETGANADPSVDILGVMKLWSLPFSFGYADAGIGLGFAHGNWGRNCSPAAQTLFFTEECDIESISTVVVPLQLSAALGKYAGAGIALSVFVSDKRPFATVSLFLPIGKFTR